MSVPTSEPARVVGRYALYGEIASGGMATVHFGRLLGTAGFARTIAVKRLHAQYAKDPEFTAMFLDEARLAARIRHPNVVPTLDVVSAEGELFLVMEYVAGESLAKLVRSAKLKGESIPPRIAVTVMASVLHGLHAAHEATNELGQPLGLVHRDVSPQNVLVGTDGVARVLDFGVAKAAGRVQTTREGQLKGKVPYMAPEQVTGTGVSRRTDVYAAACVLWETLAAQRLFTGDNEAELLHNVLYKVVDAPSHYARDPIDPAIDEIVLKGLARKPDERWPTARDMAIALEKASPPATASEIGEWVESNATGALHQRADSVAKIESSSARFDRPAIMEKPDSQPSSVSMATPPTATPPPKSRRTTMMVTIALTIVAAVAVVWVMSGKREEPRPTNAITAASTASTTSTTTSSAMASAVDTTASATTSATTNNAPPLPSTSASAPKKPPTMGTVIKPNIKPGLTKPPPSTGCDPPYSIDAKGKKIYKAECL
jgi:serine/threonine-protein kinase